MLDRLRSQLRVKHSQDMQLKTADAKAHANHIPVTIVICGSCRSCKYTGMLAANLAVLVLL